MNKFLHEPTVRLRAAAANGRGLGVVDTVRYLFGLERAGDAARDGHAHEPSAESANDASACSSRAEPASSARTSSDLFLAEGLGRRDHRQSVERQARERTRRRDASRRRHPVARDAAALVRERGVRRRSSISPRRWTCGAA